jgi:hypothetical protein
MLPAVRRHFRPSVSLTAVQGFAVEGYNQPKLLLGAIKGAPNTVFEVPFLLELKSN